MTHQGSCHCGRIAYEVEGDIAQVMECNCSHCARKGFLLWFGPRSALRLKTPESALSEYTFNRHHIKHQFCAVCGCAPFACPSWTSAHSRLRTSTAAASKRGRR
ncbi:MAG: GFA family protein, partial [Steroidobacteraceae bacterium]